ncbi:MAG: large subunit ribosomal protein L31 [Planctomycetota bacterium]|jgi:large subunit ribosomal protein L31
MKAEIHPNYVECKASCACGHTFTTQSVRSEIRTDICSECHPFYTGAQKFVDTAGRVDKFRKRYGKSMIPAPKGQQETEVEVEVKVDVDAEAKKAD